MVIYIEYVLIDNFIIDLIILLLLKTALNIKTSKFRLICASLWGSISCLIIPLITVNVFIMIALKIIIGITIVLIFEKFYSFKKIIATFLSFITITFILGGIIYSIINLFNLSITNGAVVLNNFSIPISIFLVPLIIYAYLIFILIKYFKNISKIESLYYLVKIFKNNKVYSLRGFLDTGNELKDENNNPIIIISNNVIKKLNINTTNKFINIKTITGEYKLKIVIIQNLEIVINKEKIVKQNILAGISDTNFKNYDCLLNKEIIK